MFLPKHWAEMCTALGKDSAMRSAMRVGSELKAARKKAGISVEVISKRTKITVSKLVALEKNDFKNLPKGLYLFSAVRAYAREVHIDPEPLVERLRAEFADQDALDALHALDASGALEGKRGGQEPSHLLRNSAIAAAVVLMAAAGAGAGAYLRNMGPSETPVIARSAPATAAPTAPAMEVLQRIAPAAQRAPANTHKPKARIAAVVQDIESPIQTRLEELTDTPANIEELTAEAPELVTAP